MFDRKYEKDPDMACTNNVLNYSSSFTRAKFLRTLPLRN